MKIEELQAMREWAQGKIATGAEPPWAWYQYMKLIETLDAIIGGMECTVRMDLPEDKGTGHLRVIPVVLPM